MRPGGVSAPVFATEFCTPMATLQKWEKSIKAQFGSTATDFPQFTRIMKTSAALANPPSRPSIPTHPRTPPAHPPTHMAPAHDTPTAHAATHPPIHAFTHPHIPHPTNLITQPLPPAHSLTQPPTERERGRDREAERQRGRKTERQRCRETERQRDGEADRQRETERETGGERDAEGQ